ncbi:haloacid dehalogenase [Nonomuraea glycinis]|uniref:Haloacid dehalogenase n=1 Tax=Nonomuraea glycinis TaxID=2047744 RepID=A0A918ACY5_9ACTN|nr:haloacid dehalogenase [Nonomuraea glycinis]
MVLWDIDHTLITIGGLSRNIYADAFRSATGQAMRQLADMTGRTERAIAADTLRLHHIEASDQLLHSFGLALAESFLIFEEAIRERGRVLDGALEALAMLAGHPDVVQSVLTGNMEPIAIGKLRAFDLDRFVDFDAGAYGMDHEERPELVRLAQQRATGKYGHVFTAANTVLIGDTPNDVLAGHLGGARVVAVATGSCSADTLREAGAELVLTDLSSTPAVIRAILGVADEAQ